MAADIFVSFASKDVRVAMTLCGALENRGFTCWISARDIEPGENFQSAIVRALRRAKIMLLVFTANSNTSEEMTKELALASQNKMIVIPLRVEDVTPNDAFAYEFATRQWIDVFADWEAAIEQLSRRIGQALLDRETTGRAGAAADALKTVIASANAAKLAEPTPPSEEDAEPVEAEVLAASEPAASESMAAPTTDHPVEAAVKALEALEASVGAEGAAFEAPPIAAQLTADAELPPASDDDVWRAVDDQPVAAAPTPRKPAGLLIAATVAILMLIGIVVALVARGGGSKATSSQATSSQPVSSQPPTASSTEAAATSPSIATAASDEAQSSLEATAPKPAKRKKTQPKVDIPF